MLDDEALALQVTAPNDGSATAKREDSPMNFKGRNITLHDMCLRDGPMTPETAAE